jgi:hypothetical protein
MDTAQLIVHLWKYFAVGGEKLKQAERANTAHFVRHQ